MMSATALGVFFVPVFFVLVRKIFKGSERQRKKYAHEEEREPAVEVKHD
jgi:multidrug efflux pump